MKALIWFLSLLAYGLISAFFKQIGVTLGFIPTVIIVGSTLLLARTFCQKWDERMAVKNKPLSKAGSIKQNCDDNIRFCRKCGERLIIGGKFCRKCGTQVFKTGDSPANKKCEMCDKKTDSLWYCELKDEYGTRYRNICAECVCKYKAKEINK